MSKHPLFQDAELPPSNEKTVFGLFSAWIAMAREGLDAMTEEVKDTFSTLQIVNTQMFFLR